jgi:two-component system, OmpR family, sensor kinase
MKLLKRTNRTYFIISASGFIISGVVIFFVISYFFEDQLNEKLLSDRMSVIHNIEKDGSVPVFYPFVEVKRVQFQIEQPVRTSDTSIFDVNENEDLSFRQISSVDQIKGQTYRITVRDTLIEKGDMFLIIGVIIGVIFILLTIILYFINRKLSLVIWKPFYNILNDLRKFSHTNPDFKLSSAGEIDEFIELNQTMENLTSRIISDYMSLKHFTEDASHEMQSPLAVIQSKLETLIQYPDLKSDQTELIKSAYVSVQRISKLTQTLLLLTKIVNDQFPEKSWVNMSELVEEKTDLFEDLINDKLLTLKKEIDPECYVQTNLFLAESMVINIIGNAAKHCTNTGNICIELKSTHLKISNSGIPLSVPSSKLFERFFKINPSSESPGLGLSIVKEICDLNKWKITYFFEYDQHNVKVVF